MAGCDSPFPSPFPPQNKERNTGAEEKAQMAEARFAWERPGFDPWQCVVPQKPMGIAPERPGLCPAPMMKKKKNKTQSSKGEVSQEELDSLQPLRLCREPGGVIQMLMCLSFIAVSVLSVCP